MFVCKYCSKKCKNKNALAQHEIRCKNNPNRILSYFETNQADVIAKKRLCGGCNQYTKAKQLGLPKPVCSPETRKKLSQNNKARSREFLKQMGLKVSKTVQEKVRNNEWHTSLAKRMHYTYKGCDLHGTWELAYAKWLDEHNIKWKRNKDQFDYFYNGAYHKYTPDFYLIESNEYIEIKGYETDKDHSKWEQFPKDKKLIIYRLKDLKALNVI
jgi:hypothetical protein